MTQIPQKKVLEPGSQEGFRNSFLALLWFDWRFPGIAARDFHFFHSLRVWWVFFIVLPTIFLRSLAALCSVTRSSCNAAREGLLRGRAAPALTALCGSQCSLCPGPRALLRGFICCNHLAHLWLGTTKPPAACFLEEARSAWQNTSSLICSSQLSGTLQHLAFH